MAFAACHYGMGRHFVYIEAHNKYETLKVRYGVCYLLFSQYV